MKRGEFTDVLSLICVLVVGVCSICCGQSITIFGGDIIPGDPNKPGPGPAPDANVPWDPAAHLAAQWDSASLTSRLHNPVTNPERDPNARDLSLSISGDVEVIDSNGLLGLTMMTTEVLVLDQDANELFRSPQDRRFFSRLYDGLRTTRRPIGSAGEWVSEILPYHFSVSMPLDPNKPYPTLISQLQWSMYALVADAYETIDVPFKATADWVGLVPGLEILVEQASVGEKSYQYRIKTRYDRSKVWYQFGGGFFSPRQDQVLPGRILLEMQIVDAQGQPVDQGNGSFGSGSSGGGSGDQMVTTSTGSGSCGTCGSAALIRYRFAVKPYEREARFLVENVPVPSF